MHPFIHVRAEKEVFPLRESLVENVPGSEVEFLFISKSTEQ